MLIWRLRSAKERDQILEELDALMDRKVLLQLYLTATSEKHSFWYINLLNEQDAMFYKNFEHKMLLIDKDGSQSKTATSAELHERGGASVAQGSGQRLSFPQNIWTRYETISNGYRPCYCAL
jgi:hypothetical protein